MPGLKAADVAAAMRARLFQARQRFEQLAAPTRAQDLDPDERKQLESLGYLGE